MTKHFEDDEELEALVDAVAGMKWEWLQAPLSSPAGQDATHAVIVAYDKWEASTHEHS